MRFNGVVCLAFDGGQKRTKRGGKSSEETLESQEKGKRTKLWWVPTWFRTLSVEQSKFCPWIIVPVGRNLFFFIGYPRGKAYGFDVSIFRKTHARGESYCRNNANPKKKQWSCAKRIGQKKLELFDSWLFSSPFAFSLLIGSSFFYVSLPTPTSWQN